MIYDAGVAALETDPHLHSTRRLLFIAGTTYLVWWFAVETILPGSYNPLFGRLLVVAFFFAAFGVSFLRGATNLSMDRALQAGIWLLTAHYFYLVHRNQGEMPWAVGAYIVVVAVGACLRTRATLFSYSALSLALASLVSFLNPALLRS